MTYVKVQHLYKYAKSFTWDGSKYVLEDDSSVSFIDISDTTNRTSLNNAHYTCWNTSGECTTISYIFYLNSNHLFYINLTNGKSIEDAKNEMLYNDDVNKKNSTIKTGIELWFEKYLLEYSDYLEDTVFCNDRSQSNLNINGWNPDGGDVSITMNFYGSSDLSCPKETDKFSTLNNKAKLKYKVGLPSSIEMNLLGNSSIRSTAQYDYWLGSPGGFAALAGALYVYYGSIYDFNVSTPYGVRPTISLKPNIKYITGDGSKNNPYTIDYTQYYSVNVEINNETEDLNIDINDLTQVEEGEPVNFKVTPIKGRKLTNLIIVDEDNNEIEYTTTDNKNYTFTMPSSNVTIIPSYERVKNAVIMKDNKNTKEFSIEVNDATAVVYEDNVRFRLHPEEGYEVDKIDITDEEQNKIDYRKTNIKNEYEFKMPDTDVTINPQYRKIESNSILNPNTRRQILLIVISIIIVGLMTCIYIIKKRKSKNK